MQRLNTIKHTGSRYSLVLLQAEGLELMQLILKEKRVARAGALRVVDFATTRNPPACERWVDLTGLKQLFAIFMGKSKVCSHMFLVLTPSSSCQSVMSCAKGYGCHDSAHKLLSFILWYP